VSYDHSLKPICCCHHFIRPVIRFTATSESARALFPGRTDGK
jgi:hypothetical protein